MPTTAACAALLPVMAGALAETSRSQPYPVMYGQQYPGGYGYGRAPAYPMGGYGYPSQGYMMPGSSDPQPQGSQQEEEPAPPVSPGCYLWLPQGCPRQASFKADKWKRDNNKFWADPKNINPENEGKCLGERKESFVSWCGTQSVHMVFQTGESGEPSIPDAPGCYVLTSKCPSQPWYSAKGWNFNFHPGASNSEGCSGERLRLFQKWCGNPKAQALFVTPPPKVPGCFIILPSGCPRNPNFSSPVWKRDSWPGWFDGRVPADQEGQEKFCLVERRSKLKEWCNTDRVGITFIKATDSALVGSSAAGGVPALAPPGPPAAGAVAAAPPGPPLAVAAAPPGPPVDAPPGPPVAAPPVPPVAVGPPAKSSVFEPPASGAAGPP